MRLSVVLAATAAITVVSPAIAASTVIGSGLARSCYVSALADDASARTVEECSRALEEEALSRNDAVATYVNRGILKMQMKRLAAAIADFDAALALDPAQPEAYLNKGVALLKTDGGAPQAAVLFTSAIERKTSKPEIAYFGRGLAHELQGDLRAAYDDLKQAAALAPTWDQPVQELTRYRVKPAG